MNNAQMSDKFISNQVISDKRMDNAQISDEERSKRRKMLFDDFDEFNEYLKSIDEEKFNKQKSKYEWIKIIDIIIKESENKKCNN